MEGSVRAELRRLWAEPGDPRLFQHGFTVLFLLDLALRAVGGVELRAGPLVALVVTPVLWALALAVPWPRLPAWAGLALAVADIGVVGLSRLDPSGGSGLLIAVPALWLGFVYGVRGALVTGAAGVALVMVPSLVYIGAEGINLARSVTIVTVAVVVSLAIAHVVERVRGSQRELDLERRVGAAILDTVDVGLVLLDAEGSYVTINKRHEEFMEVAFPTGHLGRAGQLGHVFHEDGETLIETGDMPTARASRGEEFDDQLIWIGPDPLTRRALSVSSRVVRDQDGAFAGAALAYKDVTDFVRALEVKDEFVAQVSHELRTPLTSISGFTALVRERDDLPAEAAHQLGVVARNVDRLDRLVADLLHTAQAERGLVHIERERTDIAYLVRQSVEAARPEVVRAGLTLEIGVPKHLLVVVDPQRFSQVVDNLLSNAVKYTPEGGRIEVDLGVTHERVELEVRDTGIGISARDRHHVFSRFFRAAHAAEQSIQGIGLGLSITKAIVESHGGRIEVESEPGRGSTFRVRLPLDVPAPGTADLRDDEAAVHV